MCVKKLKTLKVCTLKIAINLKFKILPVFSDKIPPIKTKNAFSRSQFFPYKKRGI